MKSETKALWEILVPCQFNDGKPVSTKHHREWDRKVMQYSGGLTVMKPATGQWEHEGTIYRDRTIPVRILCTDKEFAAIVRMTMLHYEQLAIIGYVISEREEIFEAPQGLINRFTRENKVAKLSEH